MKDLFVLFIVILCQNVFVNAYIEFNTPDDKLAIDAKLFEDVLDSELCDEQLRIIRNDSELLFLFADAGARTPRGILTGNFLDLGNYYQCLAINQIASDSTIEGKYCMVSLPLQQDIDWPSLPELPEFPDIPWPDLPWPELNPETRFLNNDTLQQVKQFNAWKSRIDAFVGSSHNQNRISESSPLSGLTFNLAICIPKVCSTKQFVDTLVNIQGFEVEEKFCRLPNDKPWVSADYVFIAIFSLLGLLIILSTAYDLKYNVYEERDPKKVNKLYQSFSVYNNTRRLVTYTPVPGTIDCLDGIRSFAMIWVIIGHTFVNQISSGIMANPLDSFKFVSSLEAVWVTSAPITVDTFFMLSGLLLVYTTAGKMTGMKLIKNLHLFYLNRFLRIIPVLCAMMLLQASILNWVTDGPYWEVYRQHVENCRVSWWSTLLHVQNFVNPTAMCLSHGWYLAIDFQLYVISPIILFWVLGRKKAVAWMALIGGLIAIIAASTTFNFIKRFQAGPIIPSRPNDQGNYVTYYYVNTLTRASPFFVGLIFGYILHLNRGQNFVISKMSATILWVTSSLITTLIIYSSYPITQLDWDNQFADSMMNSFMRPAWAMAIGWLIFACAHGYGGPINWVLSLRVWKILGRLSYAMYIVHYPLIFLINATQIAPVYFSVHFSFFKFFGDFLIAVIVAFLVTLAVDSPCSILIKYFLSGGQRRPPVKSADNGVTKINENKTDYTIKL